MTPIPTEFPDRLLTAAPPRRGHISGLVVGADQLAADAIATSLTSSEGSMLAVAVPEAISLLPGSGFRVVVGLPTGINVSELLVAVHAAPTARFVLASSHTFIPPKEFEDIDLKVATNLAELAACVREALGLKPWIISDRSKQILQRLAKGDSPLEAASMLGIKVGTLNNQLSLIYEQMGVRNATEAVLASLRAGLIQL